MLMHQIVGWKERIRREKVKAKKKREEEEEMRRWTGEEGEEN